MTTETISKQLEFVTYDVFTRTRLKGNPLAVVEIPKDYALSQDVKQAIAREFNFSETVFLHEADKDGSLNRRIDIFTIIAELPFAGHPTIGSICHISQSAGIISAQNFTVTTKAGPIESKYDGNNGRAVANIPHNIRIHSNYLTHLKVKSLFPAMESEPQDDLLDLWPPDNKDSFRGFPAVSLVKGMTFILINFPDVENHLQRLKVGRQARYADVVSLDEDWAPSFVAPYFFAILSEAEQQPIKIRTRMMEPQIGEDPATGSAACTLGAYLALRSGKRGGRYRYDIEQGVEMGRASEIDVEVVLAEDGRAVDSVLMSGSAIQVTKGTFLL